MSRKGHETDFHNRTCGYKAVGRAQSTLNVSAVDYYLSLSANPPSPALSTVTLTPGRIRNIDQDMEALRASRQDNPFLKQVIASRESLADCIDDIDSDNANLMAGQEISTELDADPLTMREMHEHMIRSPPPTNWPKSPNHRFFQFPPIEDETIQVEVTQKEKSPRQSTKSTPIKSNWDNHNDSVLKSIPRPHSHNHQDMFSILRHPTEDSVHLMSDN